MSGSDTVTPEYPLQSTIVNQPHMLPNLSNLSPPVIISQAVQQDQNYSGNHSNRSVRSSNLNMTDYLDPGNRNAAANQAQLSIPASPVVRSGQSSFNHGTFSGFSDPSESEGLTIDAYCSVSLLVVTELEAASLVQLYVRGVNPWLTS